MIINSYINTTNAVPKISLLIFVRKEEGKGLWSNFFQLVSVTKKCDMHGNSARFVVECIKLVLYSAANEVNAWEASAHLAELSQLK